jgi:hypothetical protein
MKHVCLVYLVEKDMDAVPQKEADTCTDESLAYEEVSRKARATSWSPMPCRSKRLPP